MLCEEGEVEGGYLYNVEEKQSRPIPECILRIQYVVLYFGKKNVFTPMYISWQDYPAPVFNKPSFIC